MPSAIAVLNAGSSSLKFRTYLLAGGRLVEALRVELGGLRRELEAGGALRSPR